MKAEGLSSAAQLLLGGARKALGKLLASFAACHVFFSGDAMIQCKIAAQTALSVCCPRSVFPGMYTLSQMQLAWVNFSVLAAQVLCLTHVPPVLTAVHKQCVSSPVGCC